MPDASLFHEHTVVVDHDGRAELIPGFIPVEVADRLLEMLVAELPWERADLIIFGRKVTEPRRSVWFAPEGMGYSYSNTHRTAHPMPDVLSGVARRAEARTGATFNSVLANHYRDGNDRLGWHADNEECNGPEPTIASVSLGAERRFDLRHNITGQTVSLVLPHGSLLVMSGTLQQFWKHQVPAARKVTSERVNLTFRLVH